MLDIIEDYLRGEGIKYLRLVSGYLLRLRVPGFTTVTRKGR